MKEKTIQFLNDTRVAFTCKGIVVGTAAGFVVSLFRLIIEKASHLVFNVYGLLKEEPKWIILWVLISLIVSLFIGYLIKSEPNIKGGGIPQVEGELIGAIKMNWWSVLWKKFIGGILSISSGVFVGAEGPSIQLGAVVGQGINHFLKGKRMDEKILISSGAGAGLAAAFNAPIGGLMFVLEEIHHHLSPLLLLTTLVSVVTSNFISLNIFGLQPVLYIGKLNIFPTQAYGHLILLGAILAALGVLYNKIVFILPKIYGLIPRLSPNFYGIIPFIIVIPIGIIYREIIGSGSEIVLDLGTTFPELKVILIIFVIRFGFCMISYGANLPGGNLIPILSLGAIIGAIYGTFLFNKMGIDQIFIRSFIVFAMAGYFSAICKAPLTAIFLVTEMAGTLNQLMPLAVISLTAYLVSDLLGGEPLYEALLERLVGKYRGNLTGKKEIIEIPVVIESCLDGGMIRDYKWPEEALITSIRRGEKEIITHGDTIIRSGDYLIILTDQGVANKVRQEVERMSVHSNKNAQKLQIQR